jgi:hypothetical protein
MNAVILVFSACIFMVGCVFAASGCYITQHMKWADDLSSPNHKKGRLFIESLLKIQKTGDILVLYRTIKFMLYFGMTLTSIGTGGILCSMVP